MKEDVFSRLFEDMCSLNNIRETDELRALKKSLSQRVCMFEVMQEMAILSRENRELRGEIRNLEARVTEYKKQIEKANKKEEAKKEMKLFESDEVRKGDKIVVVDCTAKSPNVPVGCVVMVTDYSKNGKNAMVVYEREVSEYFHKVSETGRLTENRYLWVKVPDDTPLTRFVVKEGFGELFCSTDYRGERKHIELENVYDLSKL